MLGAWRIREIILLGLCLIGGGAGGLLAMDLCNHKVKSMHLMVGVPMMICAHLVLIAFIAVDSVYLRSSQNSQPNSDASDVNSRKERGRVFRIARSDPPPAF